jgi:predicted nucleic acid-binding protein
MEKKYYLDTSIWLDFLENRNEPKRPKGDWALELMSKIIKEGSLIAYSDNNQYELRSLGYSESYIEEMLEPFNHILVHIESTEKQIRKAKDLTSKREIPRRDALHALIARDHDCILVTFDRHFKKLADITVAKSPKELISP